MGETKRNVAIRISEHEKFNGNSEPAKHLVNHPSHNFEWSLLATAPKQDRTRKNLEAFYIALLRPSLNEQVESNVLNLFRNGVT